MLKSSASSPYAYIDNFSSGYTGTYTGNITAELYIPTGVTGTNQHFIGAPVGGSGSTLSALGANASGGQFIPTSDCDELNGDPNTPNSRLFEWHENALNSTTVTCPEKGWFGKVGTDLIVPAKGYSAYLTSGNTISVTGVPNIDNTAGAYTAANLTNSNYSLKTKQTVNTPFSYISGWHLISNPFPNSVTLNGSHAGFDDAAVYNANGPFTGTFSSLSLNGGTVAPFQGFYVHVASTTSTWTWSTAERTLATGTAYHSQSSQGNLTITVSGNGFNDLTNVEFNSDATAQFDAGFDSRKMRSSLGQPTIYTSINNVLLSHNVNKRIEETPAIPLGVWPGANGTFTLNFDGINTFDPTSYIYLEDMVTGNWIDVRQNPTYTFNMSATDDPARFVLHFTPATVISSTDATCSAAGMINITQPGTSGWNYTLADASNTVISSGVLNAGSPVNISATAGIYTLSLTATSGYAVMKNIQVNGGQPVTAAFGSSANSVVQNEEVVFTSSSTGATTYDWNFGDGVTLLNQPASVSHQYASDGVYTVSLTASNPSGCEATVSKLITVTPAAVSGFNSLSGNSSIKIWGDGNRFFVDLSKGKNADAQIDVYDLIGQQLFSDRSSGGSIYVKQLNDIYAGYLIIKVKTGNETVSGKVFITNK